MNNIEKALWSSIWELEILGATSSDAYAKCKSALSDIEKCEPVAYMYQHEETGNIGFIDQWQVDNGFEKNNPRLKIITSLYTSPQPIEKCEPVAEVTAQWVIDFIGSNYNSMRTHDGQGNELSPEQITYSLTVHDLLSAFAYTSPRPREWGSLQRKINYEIL